MDADMHLALFDLDHTLLPIDSDYEWSRFLARLGVLDGDDYERENNRFYEQYKAGSLDIAEFLLRRRIGAGAHVEQFTLVHLPVLGELLALLLEVGGLLFAFQFHP